MTGSPLPDDYEHHQYYYLSIVEHLAGKKISRGLSRRPGRDRRGKRMGGSTGWPNRGSGRRTPLLAVSPGRRLRQRQGLAARSLPRGHPPLAGKPSRLRRSCCWAARPSKGRDRRRRRRPARPRLQPGRPPEPAPLHRRPVALPAVHRQRLGADAHRGRPGRARWSPFSARPSPAAPPPSPGASACCTAAPTAPPAGTAPLPDRPPLHDRHRGGGGPGRGRRSSGARIRGGAMKQAVFLDRDGTLIQDRGYICDFSQVGFFPFAAAAVRATEPRRLPGHRGQQPVRRGPRHLQRRAGRRLHRKLQAHFKKRGADIAAFYYCPFLGGRPRWPPTARTAPCASRRPACCCRPPGDFDLDLSPLLHGRRQGRRHRGRQKGRLPHVLVRTGMGRESEAGLADGGAASPTTSSTTSPPPPAPSRPLAGRWGRKRSEPRARKARLAFVYSKSWMTRN